MEKAIEFFGLGISFILFPAIALIFCSISKQRPTKIECLYMGIHFFSLVLNCFKDLYKLINEENYRKILGINESNNVSIWISLLCNIKREIPAIQKLFNLDENNNSLDISSLNDYLTEIFKRGE